MLQRTNLTLPVLLRCAFIRYDVEMASRSYRTSSTYVVPILRQPVKISLVYNNKESKVNESTPGDCKTISINRCSIVFSPEVQTGSANNYNGNETIEVLHILDVRGSRTNSFTTSIPDIL
jgi:hypothetical protein